MKKRQAKEKESSWSSAVTIYQAGTQACESGYGVGPMIRDHYLFHCVFGGKGTFTVGDVSYTVEKGEGFLIAPSIVTYYQADMKKPWKYCWLGLHGPDIGEILNHCGITMENPIFTFPDSLEMENCVDRLANCYRDRDGGFLALARLYEFFSMIQGDSIEKGNNNKLASRVRRFVDRNYSYHITVERIAEFLGCNRSHMFRVFKEEYGISVQEYLRSCRLKHAKQFIEQTDMNILEIMYSCGFNDLPNFSRQFKKEYGVPPGLIKKTKKRIDKE